MGALDSNGIYKYAESDAATATTFSELLNIGQQSVSDKTLTRVSGQTATIGSLAANGGTFAGEVIFAKPFVDRPMIGALIMSVGTTFSFGMWVHEVTPTGFKFKIRNFETVAVNVPGRLLWDALGRYA